MDLYNEECYTFLNFYLKLAFQNSGLGFIIQLDSFENFNFFQINDLKVFKLIWNILFLRGFFSQHIFNLMLNAKNLTAYFLQQKVLV